MPAFLKSMASSSRGQVSPVSPHLAQAIALHQQGRVQEAQMFYANILKQEPGNIQARYYQGLLRLQTGDIAAGIAALKQVIKRQPDHAEAHYNLGLAYKQQGNEQQAFRCFEHVIALQPNMFEARFYLGTTLASLGRHEEALLHLARLVGLRPDLAEAHHNLGGALAELGRYDEAMAAFAKAISLKPDFAEAYNGMGNVLCKCYRYEEACDQYRQAIMLKPDFAEAYSGMGEALHGRGQHEAARTCFARLLELRPQDAQAMLLLGAELVALGRPGQARGLMEEAVKRLPDSVEARSEMATSCLLWGEPELAVEHAEKALSLAAGANAHAEGALFNLHYLANYSADKLAKVHRRYATRLESLAGARRQHANLPDPERVLRVGFVSADFRRHPVGYFMTDILASFDPRQVECFAYANQLENDALTERIKPLFKHWRAVRGVSDDELAQSIRDDGIDILVDLSGYTGENRLGTFARKPAPVQVTYLGYFDTTGLKSMDYILGNRWLLPEGEEMLYAERPWRLPDAHLCFSRPDVDVAVATLPALRRGGVTFGCLNRIEKLNEKVIACWCRILNALPDSKLLLKSKLLKDTAFTRHVRTMFAAHGVAEDRLLLEGKSNYQGYLESYSRIDIALDPFPYNGGTTTVEGLWMGVPAVALKGDRYVAHMGESIMHTMQMSEWVAVDKDEYVEKAVAFANDLPALAALRAGLRQRLQSSPICDAPSFARNLEEAFRAMWRQWCNGRYD